MTNICINVQNIDMNNISSLVYVSAAEWLSAEEKKSFWENNQPLKMCIATEIQTQIDNKRQIKVINT